MLWHDKVTPFTAFWQISEPKIDKKLRYVSLDSLTPAIFDKDAARRDGQFSHP